METDRLPRSLNDVCEFIVDCLHATAPIQESGYPLVRTPNIGRGRLNLEGVQRVSEETYRTWTKRAIPEPGDLILAREAPAGNVALVCEGQKVCLGQRTVHLRPDRAKVDPSFLSYYLNAPRQRARLLASETGATAKHVNMSDIRKLPIEDLPALDEQRHISAMLAAYDDLIEINRKRIQLLDESVRLLYHEWFVSLRFPGHEHSHLNNGVPEGWKEQHLSEVADINRESLPSKYDGMIEYIDISSVTPGSINCTTTYSVGDAPPRARRVVRHGDVIWSCVRPNRRSYAVIWQPIPNLIVSTGFAVITPVTVPTSFLLQAITTDSFVGVLEKHARGVAYPAVVAADFERSVILVPPLTLLEAFNVVAEPIISQTHTLRCLNVHLRAARDLLRPRLLCGGIPI